MELVHQMHKKMKLGKRHANQLFLCLKKAAVNNKKMD